MMYLAIPTLRARWASFVGVFATVAAAVALITATGVLLESGIRGDVPPERLAGADIVVAGDQSISEHHGKGDDAETVTTAITERVPLSSETLTEVASVPGVESVVPDVSFRASLLRPDGSAVPGPSGAPSLGHSWSSAALTPFHLTDGHLPEANDEIVIDTALARRADVRVGQDVTVLIAGDATEARLVGLATPADGELRQQSAVFFDDETAVEHYGRGDSVDLLGVTVTPGADVSEVAAALRSALDGRRVGADR